MKEVALESSFLQNYDMLLLYIIERLDTLHSSLSFISDSSLDEKYDNPDPAHTAPTEIEIAVTRHKCDEAEAVVPLVESGVTATAMRDFAKEETMITE
jgi:hypothetical protein